MTNENLWQNPKNSENQPTQKRGSIGSRYSDVKGQAEQAKYDAHYHRIQRLIEDNVLDFRKVAERTRLKERKIRETLLFRLAPSDMIQLFGHKEGSCYICGLKVRSSCSKEPLCIICLEIIDEAIQETHAAYLSNTSEAAAPPTAIPAENTEVPAYTGDMVPREQYDKLVAEVTQYRERYGPLESSPSPPEEKPTTEAQSNCAAEELEDKPTEDVLQAILNTDEDGEDPLTPEDSIHDDSPQGTVQHFGFQRLNSRN